MTNSVYSNNAFGSTCWMDLARLQSLDTNEGDKALDGIYTNYRAPLLFFITQQGYSQSDSEDFLQEFFYSLIKNKTLYKADKSKGKFRSFLLGCLKNFIFQKNREQHRIKRGGNASIIAIDAFPDLDLADPENVDKATHEHDRIWAECLVERAFSTLQDRVLAKGLPFDKLEPLITNYSLATLQEVADELDYSVPKLKSLIYRIRQQYAGCIKEEVAKTVSSSTELDEELRYLLDILAK